MFSVAPDEHLGSKIYTPRDPDTIAEMNHAAFTFSEKVGPKTAKFVQLYLMSESPNYPERTRNKLTKTCYLLLKFIEKK